MENDPIKADEVSNTEEGVMGVVTQFFKKARKRKKIFLKTLDRKYLSSYVHVFF